MLAAHSSTAAASQTSPASPGYPWLSTPTQDRTSYQRTEFSAETSTFHVHMELCFPFNSHLDQHLRGRKAGRFLAPPALPSAPPEQAELTWLSRVRASPGSRPPCARTPGTAPASAPAVPAGSSPLPASPWETGEKG